MLNKRVSIGLFALLLCHTLACVVVCIGGWWQAEGDLSERLLVYRSVDSITEFQIPLADKTDGTKIARTTEAGFRYHGHYYNVISLEILGDTLHIAGLESTNHSFWQDDLLAFLDNHLATSSDTGRKANQLLKLLLKEYSPGSRMVLNVPHILRCEAGQIAQVPLVFSTRPIPICSPPPERPA